MRRSEVNPVSGATTAPNHDLKQSQRSDERAVFLRKDASETPWQPTYAGLFQCIGPKCEDPCCGDWDIPVDKVTYQRYRQFPQEKLGSLVSNFVFQNPEAPCENVYAYIHRTELGKCPFFREDRLCDIQKEYGQNLLSSTCSLYPRSLSRVNGRLEGTLSLSCPEAARFVLLNPSLNLLKSNLQLGDFRTDNVFSLAYDAGSEREKPAYFLAVRTLLIDLVRDRSRPIWQRLLIVASFCERLDEVTTDGSVESVPALLDRYQVAIGQGAYAELDGLPRDLKRRIELAITLSNGRSSTLGSSQRFRDAFWDFIEGIGSTDSSDSGDDMVRFRTAEKDYYLPLLQEHPYLVENYLVNHMLQHLFPYGRAGSERFIIRSAFDESLLMSIQFSWVSSLLIGIAGHCKEHFSKEHIVSTVQSFTRATDHAPHVLNETLAAVKQRGLDDLSGISILLRT